MDFSIVDSNRATQREREREREREDVAIVNLWTLGREPIGRQHWAFNRRIVTSHFLSCILLIEPPCLFIRIDSEPLNPIESMTVTNSVHRNWNPSFRFISGRLWLHPSPSPLNVIVGLDWIRLESFACSISVCFDRVQFNMAGFMRRLIDWMPWNSLNGNARLLNLFYLDSINRNDNPSGRFPPRNKWPFCRLASPCHLRWDPNISGGPETRIHHQSWLCLVTRVITYRYTHAVGAPLFRSVRCLCLANKSGMGRR